MTEIEALITKARRYCNENHSYWVNKYQNERTGTDIPYTYTDNDYNLFPRYNALSTILQGVETIVGKDFATFDNCKDELKRIGAETHSIDTIESNKELHLLGKLSNYFKKSGKLNKIEINAIQDERLKFIQFITEQTTESVLDVEPLPFERKLTQEESEQVRVRLLKSWNFDGDYWEPLDNKSPNPTVFLMDQKITALDKSEIEQTIKAYSKSDKLFVITEDLVDYEIEKGLIDIDLYESIICDNTFEWVVYGSHESTTAFGGKFLIDKVNELYSNRKEQLNKWDYV
ncbi:MAG: hypothetical protein CL843_15075 [Crocinitomicaceae bacterium]|nr:hypothetical protein [Crocinitomicaceae bacterium]